MKNVTQALVLLLAAAVPAYAGVPKPVTTTPEPATIALVATGAGVIGVVTWIRRRKK